jgi:hypothetical protein
MFIKPEVDLEEKMLLDLNTFIHQDTKQFEYHMKHIDLVKKYSLIINNRIGLRIDSHKLAYIALAHDLLKERGLDPSCTKQWKNHDIPQDLNRYIRLNLDVLETYGLEDYFNTDIQQHPLAAGIFLHKELGIRDPEILYPIMFHSCPIIDVYETLNRRIQTMIDITILSDKLSSNYLRINLKNSEVRVYLDQVVFGTSGNEFNYTLGLFIARLLGQGNSTEIHSVEATEYYYKRLCDINPLMSNLKSYSIKKIGDAKIWPKRNSKVLMMR